MIRTAPASTLLDPSAAPQRPRAASSHAFAPACDVAFLSLDDQAALFKESRQDLFELNATAELIWRLLVEHGSYDAIAAALSDILPQDLVQAYVSAALTDWVAGGWIVSDLVADQLQREPTEKLTLGALDFALTLRFFGAPAPPDVREVFAPLISNAGAKGALDVVVCDQRFHLFSDGCALGQHEPATLVPALKAFFTAELAQKIERGFLVHGGLVAHEGQRCFILGEPGDGKSTLVAAMRRYAFEVLTDDVVQMDGGAARGAPFAIALKPGSWPLLNEALPVLSTLPIYQRQDRQEVKYLPGLVHASSDWAGIDHLIKLERIRTATPFLKPLARIEALRLLLASSYSPQGRVSAGQLAALGSLCGAMTCHTLIYSDPFEAAAALKALVDD